MLLHPGLMGTFTIKAKVAFWREFHFKLSFAFKQLVLTRKTTVQVDCESSLIRPILTFKQTKKSIAPSSGSSNNYSSKGGSQVK